jgi:YVTN family beta-propeller protein
MIKRLGLVALVGLLAVASRPDVHAQQSGMKLRIIQNAMAGDAVTVIDPATNKVVGEIPGIEISNGVAVSPDGARIYTTGEVEKTLFVADAKTYKVEMKVPLSGRPSAVAVAKDGSKIFVGIQDQGGTGMDIVDAASLKVIKNLPLEGMKTHYIFVTPDGKYAAATANGGATPAEGLTIRFVDTKTNEFVKKITGEGTGGHRVCDFYPNPDNSTKYVLCNQGGLAGFVVYDFNAGTVVKKVQLNNAKTGEVVRLRGVDSAQGSPSHGIAVSPDRKMVVVSDRWHNLVHVFSAPDFTELYSIPMAVDPFWFAWTPDSKMVYASAAFTEMVSAIDIEKRLEVARIHVQAEPKRVVAAMIKQ